MLFLCCLRYKDTTWGETVMEVTPFYENFSRSVVTVFLFHKKCSTLRLFSAAFETVPSLSLQKNFPDIETIVTFAATLKKNCYGILS